MAATSTMTIRMGADEKSLINDYAKTFGMTLRSLCAPPCSSILKMSSICVIGMRPRPNSMPIRLPIPLTK